MASVGALRTAIKNTIQAYLGPNVYVSDTVPAAVHLPGIVVEPAKADFVVTMGRGLDEWYFNVMVLCSRADEKNGQNNLDEFVAGSGPKSIRQAIYQNPTLGLSDSTAVVTAMRGYGGTRKEAGIGVTGAILVVCVRTSGTS